MVKGKITKEYTFWCGNQECSCWRQVSGYNKKEAIQEARNLGWKLTKKYGWICPYCDNGLTYSPEYPPLLKK